MSGLHERSKLTVWRMPLRFFAQSNLLHLTQPKMVLAVGAGCRFTVEREAFKRDAGLKTLLKASTPGAARRCWMDCCHMTGHIDF